MLKVRKIVPKEKNANRSTLAAVVAATVAPKKERERQLTVEYLLPLADSLVLFLEAALKVPQPQPKVRHDHLKNVDPEARINVMAMETETMIPEKDQITDAVVRNVHEKIHRGALKNGLA